jgi:hypothetical protein
VYTKIDHIEPCIVLHDCSSNPFVDKERKRRPIFVSRFHRRVLQVGLIIEPVNLDFRHTIQEIKKYAESDTRQGSEILLDDMGFKGFFDHFERQYMIPLIQFLFSDKLSYYTQPLQLDNRYCFVV